MMARIWHQPFNAQEYEFLERALECPVPGVPEPERRELLEKVEREKKAEQYYDSIFGKKGGRHEKN